MSDDTFADGEWAISASFAPSLLDKGLASTRRVLDTWWQEGVTEAELSARKQGLVGGYFVGLSTTGGLAGAILNSVQRGYDVSWLDGYPRGDQGADPQRGQSGDTRAPRIRAPWCWSRREASRPQPQRRPRRRRPHPHLRTRRQIA